MSERPGSANWRRQLNAAVTTLLVAIANGQGPDSPTTPATMNEPQIEIGEAAIMIAVAAMSNIVLCLILRCICA